MEIPTSDLHQIYQAIANLEGSVGRLEGSVQAIYWFLALGFTALTAFTGGIAYLVYDLNKFVHHTRQL